MSKTQELLEGLNNITKKPTRFGNERINAYTNRYYPNNIHTLPKTYDKAKRYKDEDGEQYIKIDRVYGGLYDQELLQKDGTFYKGKLQKKRRHVSHKDITGEKNNFFSRCMVTADGRWFDNSGLPIEAPTKLEPEKQKTEDEIAEEQRELAEKAKAKEAAILANLK